MRPSRHAIIAGLALAACARTAQVEALPRAREVAPAHPILQPSVRDARVGLRPGWMNAAEAVWNLRVVSRTPPSPQFMPPTPGDFQYINSDLSFYGQYAIQGNFRGVQVWNMADVAHPVLHRAFVCPGSQSDVSVYRSLLFVSGEALDGRTDCGTQGVGEPVSHDRLRGIRIFDITDIANPKLLANVQTCRGSHTHTVVSDPRDTANVYVYVSGAAPVRSPNELAGCSEALPEEDPNSALFRIEVIQVPLAAPQRARIVSTPRIFAGLTKPPEHGEAPNDIRDAARLAAAARAQGMFTAKIEETEIVLAPTFIDPLLDSIMKARGGVGAPVGADSSALRRAIQGIIDRIVAGPPGLAGRGPTQCHDITVYPAIGLAGGACGGYGLLLDIRDPAHPRRVAAAADSNFAYWHSATFNNDGTKILFTDEWGGGLQPRCRVTDKPQWGANAIFTLADSTMTFRSYYKLPAPQTPQENCVAHNGNLIPIPGRDIMVQGWYQGGISVFDWTDAAHPVEVAYFDRGPVNAEVLVGAGSWSAYWYNGYIVSSEIARGLDIVELMPSALISQNEIDAAKSVRVDYLNAQHQRTVVWPASVAVPRAYLDQLERAQGLSGERITAVRHELTRADGLTGAARRDALTVLAGQLEQDAAGAKDQAKTRAAARAVRELAGVP